MVVESGAGQQRAVGAQQGGLRGVEQAKVPPRNVGGRHVRLRAEPVDEVAIGRCAGAPDRGEVLLFVEQQPFVVHIAVEVNGQLWHASNWLMHGDINSAAVAQRNAAGHAEVAVEP